MTWGLLILGLWLGKAFSPGYDLYKICPHPRNLLKFIKPV